MIQTKIGVRSPRFMVQSMISGRLSSWTPGLR
ncbi:hypothetical protein PPTG_21753 [Phytophthora nicotianae INRA-310]|uniref:Uncharacterized protein n=1 Tax=Phytophthora nicotianae (strain INRA-310) TaxID=761204 RepID=W2QU65_PHYN3|nr:hypothetical protein PPTG_21753 [Phytophthora nicotianae INRA-310]ETN16643.1 hypothetical protein PPTG_21753 [Phytophthora nicotianae INRA-310]